jgi:two-component system cell cycle sensor histidine kinase/response regulator CckA
MSLHKKRRTGRRSAQIASMDLDKSRAIVEYAPEILALIDGEGIIRCVNPHMEKVLHYASGEVEGRNIFDFIHPEDAARAAQEYADTVQQEGERIPSVLRLQNAQGGWVPFEIIANNRLEDPLVKGVIFTARDLRFRHEIEDAIQRTNADVDRDISERITELAKINATLRIENQARRQAELKLQHTISLLNATLDSTADGILVVSAEGTVTSCNRRFVEMWRFGCDFSVGKDDQELLDSVIHQLESPNDFLDRVRALYASPSETSFDVLHLRDGRIFERYSQPQDIDGNIVGRVWSFRDVTRARNLELDLRQSQKMEALGRLAGGIAHDFNNLLMLITGYIGQLMENPPSAERDDIHGQVLAITKRAAGVTKQLLAFSRKLPDAPTVADLNVIVIALERLLRRLLSDQIELQVALSSDAQPVYVDVSKIELVIMNLTINAQDAMPEGGLLSIAISSELLPTGPDGKGESKVFSVLEVSDTGGGMTEEVRSHIFEPFFTTKGLGKGTGLGLSTVLGIVKQSGGHIKVETREDNGTSFRVCLPRAETAAISVPLPASTDVAAPTSGTETILIAEDEGGIRAMTTAYLEGLGYRVLQAADGREAIRLSLEYSGTIDVILTDLVMPGIRGDVAVEEIRRSRPGIKAVFMSGYMDQDPVGAIETLLHKPFEFPELGQRLRLLLDSRDDD